MSRAFAITVSPDAVTVKGGETRKVTFTVTNNLPESTRVRVRAVPAEPLTLAWLDLPAETEKPLDAQGTEQFTITVHPPAGAAAGACSFRLDAVSVDNPDEHFAEGPSVAVTVQASEKEKKPFPWWILAVIAAVLVVGGLTAWWLTRGAPGLHEPCEGACAAGLTCVGDPATCRGAPGFAPCTDGSDCSPELLCAPRAGAEGEAESLTCVVPLGQSGCQEDGHCASGQTCQDGTCRGELGYAGCTDTSQCAHPLLCWDDTCQEDTVGNTCTATRDCAPGQTCVALAGANSVCLRQVGQPCQVYAECVSLLCDEGQGVCTALDNGQSCKFGAQCQSGICHEGTCKAFIPCGPGDTCPAFMVCKSGRCTNRRTILTIPGTFFEGAPETLKKRRDDPRFRAHRPPPG